jgi:hypothetical protein
MHKTTLTSAMTLFFVGFTTLTAAAQSVHDARIMWSAFQCGIFAEMAGDTQEQQRLFLVGIKAGRQFIAAIQRGQISSDALNTEVPIGVLMLLGGPSVDFMIGRIAESATKDAFDAIVSKDENGMPLQWTDRIRDEEHRKIKAQNRYLKSNCALIRLDEGGVGSPISNFIHEIREFLCRAVSR